MNSLLFTHFLVKCCNITAHSNDTALEVKSLICTVFSRINIFLARVDYVIFVIETNWIFFFTIKIFKEDDNLLANVTFPYKTLRVRSFGMIRIRISDPRSLGSW